MFVDDIGSYLVNSGTVAGIVKWAILGLLAGAVKYLRDLIKHQRKTNDLLRTDTPGGLADLKPPPRVKPPLPPK